MLKRAVFPWPSRKPVEQHVARGVSRPRKEVCVQYGAADRVQSQKACQCHSAPAHHPTHRKSRS
eukprot:scaffold132762_cov30-Tisochrysis_lutea.AAC.6